VLLGRFVIVAEGGVAGAARAKPQCFQIAPITSAGGGSLNDTTFIRPPHPGQDNGSTSSNRLINIAHAELLREMVTSSLDGSSDTAASAHLGSRLRPVDLTIHRPADNRQPIPLCNGATYSVFASAVAR
jgi:hypothetical protein